MDEIILLIYSFLMIFPLFQTLNQTTENSNDSESSTDMLTSGFMITRNTMLFVDSGTNGEFRRESSTSTPDDRLSIETVLFSGLRVWHVAGLAVSAVLIIIIIVCCRVNIRIPRSNQEIDDDDRKRIVNKKYIKELDLAADGIIMGY